MNTLSSLWNWLRWGSAKVTVSQPSTKTAFDELIERLGSPTEGEPLRVAGILDNSTLVGLSHDVALTPLHPSSWQSALIDGSFDLLLIESGERGNANTWKHCFSRPSDGHRAELSSVLAKCRELNIPTVFWNTEVPAINEDYLAIGQEFDFVFAADQTSLEKYRRELGQERVGFLPLAIQPKIHQPTVESQRINRIGFIGSWNSPSSPERQNRLRQVFGAVAESLDLTIFDTDLNRGGDKSQFPAEYTSKSSAKLTPKDRVANVYQRFAAVIDVDSASGSSAPFSRTMVEAAACGIPIIGTHSAALEEVFPGTLAPANDADELKQLIESIGSGDWEVLKRVVRGVRAAHENHTYQHRLRTIAERVGLSPPAVSEMPLTAICVSMRPHLVEHVASQLLRQNRRPDEVIYVCHSPDFNEQEIREAFRDEIPLQVFRLPDEGFLGDGLNLAVEHATGRYLAKIDDDDFYGPNYFRDALLAMKYSGAAMVGKETFFAFVESTNQLVVRFPNKHYRYRTHIAGPTFVWDGNQTRDIPFVQRRQGTDSAFQKQLVEMGLKIFATDPFNFLMIRHADQHQHTWRVNDEEFLSKTEPVSKGLDLEWVEV
ncbi:MAG: glycosyltransferase [Planctomycetales bacterium]|nr:glycosyltransferase [Planctomycetales bacterium]